MPVLKRPFRIGCHQCLESRVGHGPPLEGGNRILVGAIVLLDNFTLSDIVDDPVSISAANGSKFIVIIVPHHQPISPQFFR